MEFHDAVGNHETQAGRQLGSEELLLREPQRFGLLKASLSYTCYGGAEWVVYDLARVMTLTRHLMTLTDRLCVLLARVWLWMLIRR
jgi:hypothetical protein